ncbi:hypothetical protein X777_12586 [Ooceraea biroi]|uniref:Uncharacterized protein n=1 Tax=Ooceraea biroi TaxID=2015173 RepID=A0A026VZK1_OOCBI|nr:hypothetical protein X777_12586 [Ooceraea biroi]
MEEALCKPPVQSSCRSVRARIFPPPRPSLLSWLSFVSFFSRGLKKDLAAREGEVESATRGIPEFHELRRRVENVGASIILVGIERREFIVVVGLVEHAAVAGVRSARKARRGNYTAPGRPIELDNG